MDEERKAKEREEAEKKLVKARKAEAANVRSNTTSGRQTSDRWDDDQALSAAYDSIVAG